MSDTAFSANQVGVTHADLGHHGPSAAEDASGYLASWTKRTIDVAGASALIVLLSPLLLVVAGAIAATSKGPVLFLQERTGRAGRTFRILKFRSMVIDADADDARGPDGYRQATRNDPRVTAVGRIIRRTSIDELPQLINVLKGDMSLVGPRPHPVALDEQYADRLPDYRGRYATRPGITGLAQVSGARGETPTVEHMRRRLAHDHAYVRGASLLGDVRILVATVRVVARSRGAY